MIGYKITSFRDGVSQQRRSLAALDPATVQLEDREVGDLLALVVEFSKQFAYYDIDNNHIGDWSAFFTKDSIAGLDQLAQKILNSPQDDIAVLTDGRIAPHLALLLTFLILTESTKYKINEITLRQLRFYYLKLLGFKPKAGAPDRVQIILELNNSLTSYKIGKGTSFFAGNGVNGGDLLYETDRETIITKAQVVDWRATYVNSNGTTTQLLSTSIGKSEPTALNPWHIFGEGRLSEAGLNTAIAATGWAIESPLLYLQEGERKIDIEIVTSGNSIPISTEIPINAYVSTEIGWVKVDVLASTYENNLIKVSIAVSSNLPPIVPNSALASGNTRWPIVKLLLSREIPISLYQNIIQNTIENIKIIVNVLGFKTFSLNNPEGIIGLGGPISAFGALPEPGARLLLGMNEIRYKPLSYLKISYKWKGAPANLGQHYLEYFYANNKSRPTQPVIGNSNYKGQVQLLQEGTWQILDNFDLFPTDASVDVVIWDSIGSNPGLSNGNFQTENRLDGPSELRPLSSFPQNGYLALKFEALINNTNYFGPKGFGHAEYPRVFSEIAIGKSTPAQQAIYGSVNLPNTPYSPILENLTVDYSASEIFQPKFGNDGNRFYHISPFGIYEAVDAGKISLIPQHEPNAFIYLGLNNLNPPQNLALLIQFEENSSGTDKDPGKIVWSYLSDNVWHDLGPQNIITDQTFELKTSGIVEFNIPSNASSIHSAMPSGLFWIRVGIFGDINGIQQITNFHTQAITVVYSGALENKPNRLPSESIKKMVDNNGQIKKIVQPYPSFGGRPLEPDKAINQRIQERLKHRNRALNYWDFEHLILDHFHEVYKVKCIVCSDGILKSMPGHLALIIVPEQRGKRILEPKSNPLVLAQIAKKAQLMAQPGLTIHALNPVYETVIFDFKVAFLPGFDPGYYQQLLNDELKAFVSPWAFDESREIFFGATIFRSEVINFIENRSYVDFITNFEMYSLGGEMAGLGVGDLQIVAPGVLPELDDFTISQSFKPGINAVSTNDGMVIGDSFVVGIPVAIATVSQPSGILVSAQKHRVRLISPGDLTCSIGTTTSGINNMAVEIDLEIL